MRSSEHITLAGDSGGSTSVFAFSISASEKKNDDLVVCNDRSIT